MMDEAGMMETARPDGREATHTDATAHSKAPATHGKTAASAPYGEAPAATTEAAVATSNQSKRACWIGGDLFAARRLVISGNCTSGLCKHGQAEHHQSITRLICMLKPAC
jgi:hypothetical protein